MALKRIEPALRYNLKEMGITRDEIDAYEQYIIINPNLSPNWIIAGTAGTSATNSTLSNIIPDYPRNIQFSIAGSAAGMAGTAVINGKSQFGSIIQETLGFTAAANGGTTIGTAIFAQFTSGTVTYGTAVGNGTMGVGFPIAGTTTKFGLPDKLGSLADVFGLTLTAGTGAVAINGGTIQGFVDTTYHAIKAPVTITGTMTIAALYHPTFQNEGYRVAGGTSTA